MINYLKHGWGLFSVLLCLTVIIPISTIIFFFLIPGDETWIHLRDNVLNSYISNSLYLMIFVGGGSIIIGSITFTGSLVAWAKLNGSMKDLRLPKYNLINNILFLALVAFGAYIVIMNTDSTLLIYGLLAASLVYGYLFVAPIGGADMPVVISLLNSLTGIAAAITGILYNNMVISYLSKQRPFINSVTCLSAPPCGRCEVIKHIFICDYIYV